MYEKLTSSVLVLEEEALIALDVEYHLVLSGFTVAAVLGSCSDALKWLAEHNPDVVILDVRLRDGSCGHFAEVLHACGIPFIVHSSTSSISGTFDKARSKGRWFFKPCDPDALVGAIASTVRAPVPQLSSSVPYGRTIQQRGEPVRNRT